MVLSVSAWASVIAVVAGASFGAGIKATRISDKLDATNRKLAEVLTKRDLQDVKREVSAALFSQVSSGQAWCNCPAFERHGEKRSHCTFSGFVLPDFPPLPLPSDDTQTF